MVLVGVFTATLTSCSWEQAEEIEKLQEEFGGKKSINWRRDRLTRRS
ncbi:MAG: hypothetical protein Ct9H300mP1_02650 [Planctomycetaceae bacterium]|nr:MAG: hypothetical protein Ct9H300mP1_02650 [Planctomycetaceae bacterium]